MYSSTTYATHSPVIWQTKLIDVQSPQLCSETGEDVSFGEDAFYDEIIKKDSRGFDFAKQRDTWKEGTPFSFSAEFFAEEDRSDATPAGGADSSVVETTAVDADAGSQ
jgi:hypothetical protein